jgi:hypothetical protein
VLLALLLASAGQETGTAWLPSDLLYPHPLADPRGPFTGSRVQVSLIDGRNTTLENVFGEEQSLVRVKGLEDAFEIVAEGAVFARFDVDENLDMDAADFRFGFPLVYRRGPLALKLHPWHITSHLGDEYIEREGVLRISYGRNELAFGAAWHPTSSLRLHAEGGWGFAIDAINDPWRVMGGAEVVDRLLGPAAPEVYLAANVTAWKETDWTPQLNLQAGVWLRSASTPSGLRVGTEYFRGPSALTQFFQTRDHYLAVGIWIHF